jgi:hypothetical protein
LLVAVVMVAALAFCGSAGAANLTIGPDLTHGEWVPAECALGPSCTWANFEVGGSVAPLVSPVSGAVVGFSVLGGSTAGSYQLRTVLPGETATSWIFRRVSAEITAVPNAGVQTYAVTMPISAGQSVALTASETASVSGQSGTGELAEWGVELPGAGHSTAEAVVPGVIGLDAEIQPAPTVTGLSVTTGPEVGDTSVTISGADLEGATVHIGKILATVTGASETAITVLTPPSSTARSTTVTVTTVAGTAKSPVPFVYQADSTAAKKTGRVKPATTAPKTTPAAVTPKPTRVARCVVPNLKGRSLKAARKSLARHRCRLGKVTRLGGATPKTGRISRQAKAAGSELAAGTKVRVTLKPAAS